jgi:hypothetical protein
VNAAGAAIFLAAAAAAQPASADADPCGSSRPWVEIAATEEDSIELEALLRAQLSSRGIDLCRPAARGSASIATVSVTAEDNAALLDVEVRDRLTAKRVVRDVDLSAVPRDGRAFTLAVVADELLRASWAELALANAPPPAAPVPVEVVDALRGDGSASRALAARIEAVGALEHWAGGATLFGADLRFGLATPSGLGATVRLGAREGAAQQAADGQVETTALLAGLSASYRATPQTDRFGVDALVRVDVAHVAYVAVPSVGATGTARADTTGLVGAGLDGWLALGSSARVLAELLVDAPLRDVVAQDAGRQVVAVSGAGIEGGLGIRAAF